MKGEMSTELTEGFIRSNQSYSIFIGVTPQKYSRTARLEHIALLLISSLHFARAFRPPDGTRNFTPQSLLL